MSTERLAMKGALADKRLALKKNRLLAQGLFDAIRSELKPYVEIHELDMPRIHELLSDLHARWSVIRQLREEIAKLDEELNG